MTKYYLMILFALAPFGCGDEVVVEPFESDAGFVVDPVTNVPDMFVGNEEPDMASPAIDMGPTEPLPNEGWVGGACSDSSDCDYEGATCLDWPGGTCSQPCERFCPDRDGLNSVTFCIEEDGQGACVARCDNELYPGSGCREGYKCQIRKRFEDPGVEQGVCVPEGAENPNATSECLRDLDALGIPWSPWNYETQYDDGLACTVDDPIRVASPINGVEYRYYSQSTSSTMAMACPLALALHQLGDILRDYEIDTVLHIGTFNCRKVAGTSSLSQHGLGLAIDIWGFEDVDDANYILEQHWEHGTPDPGSPKAQVLYDIGQRMYEERVFNIVLTPNYNSAHDNHFHVDLKVGGNFLGYVQPEYWIGSDRNVCPGHD